MPPRTFTWRSAQKLVSRWRTCRMTGRSNRRASTMLAVKALLAFGVQPGTKVVEPDFARATRRGSARCRTGWASSSRSSSRARPVYRGECPGRSCRHGGGGQQAHAVPVAALYRGQHAMHHAPGPGLLAHRVHIDAPARAHPGGRGCQSRPWAARCQSAQHARSQTHHPVAARGQ